MHEPNLGRMLHQAKLVIYDEHEEVTYAWFGGHGIASFDAYGNTIEYWNTGNFAYDACTIEQAEESINRRIGVNDAARSESA